MHLWNFCICARPQSKVWPSLESANAEFLSAPVLGEMHAKVVGSEDFAVGASG